MNKFIVTILLALGMIASSEALASRARMIVMGSGDTGNVLVGDGNSGSFYVDDAYNMFYNPSYIHNNRDWAIVEKNNRVGGNGGAQGGFVTSVMNYHLGLFFNRMGEYGNYGLGVGPTPTNDQGFLMKPIDLIVGGDNYVKWGASMSYGSFKNANGTDKDLILRAGIQNLEGFDPFVAYKVLGDEDSTLTQGTDKPTHKLIMGGARYHWGEWVPYVAARRAKRGANLVNQSYVVGLGRNTKLSENIKTNYALGATWNSANAGGPTLRIPFNLSIEAEALSWLTLRGGLEFRIWDRVSQKSNTADTTTGRIGASFRWSRVNFDWAIGTAGAVGEDPDQEVFGFDGDFFTAASLSYHW